MASEAKCRSSKTAHCIYQGDPIEQVSLVNRAVEVTRRDGHKIRGTLFTVDPVSESVVLVNRGSDGGLSMDVVLGHAILSTAPLPEEPPTPLENVFPSSSRPSEGQLRARRLRVRDWLRAHHLPVTEEGDVLRLDRALCIGPPYGVEQCVADTEIILDRVQQLILDMPPHT